MEKDLSKSRRRWQWVLLQAPGVNLATIGSLLLLCVHLTMTCLMQRGLFEEVQETYSRGGLTYGGVASGQVWQLVSHAGLHGSWVHLLTNVGLFYYAVARLSHIMRDRRILLLFLLCVLGSALTHVVAQGLFSGLPQAPLVGASGGVIGLLCGFFAISPGSRMLLLNLSASNLAKGVLISSAFFFLLTPGLGIPLLSKGGVWLEEAVSGSFFQIAHLTHFSGGFIGLLLAPQLLPRLLTMSDLSRMRMEVDQENGSFDDTRFP